MTTLTSPVHTGAFPSLADLHTFELAQEAENREAYNQEMDELARRTKRKVKGLPEGIDLRHLETIRPDPAVIPWKERTKEEQEYLDESAFGLRAHGKTFRQIGAHFGFSPSTGHAMVKRHLYRQRKELSEHLADIRDYELLLLSEMLPLHIDKAKNGDPRALALVLDSLRLKLRLLKFSNPTVDEELSAKLDMSRQLAKGYDEAVFEREESILHAPREEDITRSVMDTVEPGPVRMDCEQVRTNSEHQSEQNTQGIANAAVAAKGTFSSEQATGLGSAINIVLMLILLAVCQVGPVCRTGPVVLGMSSDGGDGTWVGALLENCALEKGPPRQGGPTVLCVPGRPQWSSSWHSSLLATQATPGRRGILESEPATTHRHAARDLRDSSSGTGGSER